MDPAIASLPPGDPKLISTIVDHLKSQGLFDQFRKHCLSDIDTKPGYQNLRQRVEGYVANFLEQQQWRPDLNKNQLRDSLRRSINESGMLAIGVDRIVEQVVNPKVYQVFYSEIATCMFKLLGKDLPSSGSFMQKCLDNSTMDSTNPEVPGEEKSSLKLESDQESLQKIIGFTDDAPAESSAIINDKQTDSSNKQTSTNLESGDTKPDSSPTIKTDPDSEPPPTKVSIETQTDSLLESSKTVEEAKENVSKKKDDDKKEQNKKNSTESEKKKTHDKKDEKKSDKQKSSKGKHEKVKSKTHGELSKDAKESKDSKVKKVEVKSDKEKSKTSSSKPKTEKSEKSKDDGSKSSKNVEKSKESTSKSHKITKQDKTSSTDSETASKGEKKKEHKKSEKSEKPKSGEVSKHKTSDENKKIIKVEKVKSDNKKSEKVEKLDGKSDSKIEGKSGSSESKSDGKNGKSEKKLEVKSEKSEKKIEAKSDKSETKFSNKSEKSESKSKSKDSVKRSHSKDKGDVKREKKHSSEKTKTEDKHKHEEKLKSKSIDKEKQKMKSEEKPKDVDVKKSSDTKIKEKELKKINETEKKEEKKESKELDKSKSCTQKIDQPIVKPQEGKVVNVKDKSEMRSKRRREHSEESKQKRLKSESSKRESFSEERNKDDNSGEWSDVTVSSVHTSDLSDYDDHISLTDSEIDGGKGRSSATSSKSASPIKRPRGRPRKDQSLKHQELIKKKLSVYQSQIPVPSKFREPKIEPKTTPKIEQEEAEPRRELRRQRKVNPRYSSDDFASIFSKGKDKLQFQEDEDNEQVSEDEVKEKTVKPVQRGRKSTYDNTDSELPYSPRSDISELETPSRRHSKETDRSEIMGRPLSPKSDLSCELQSPRTPESNCSTESRRRQHYDSSDLYKPRPSVRGGRRNRPSERYDDSDLYKPRSLNSTSRRARGSSPNRSVDLSPAFNRQDVKSSPGLSPEVRSTATTPSSDKHIDDAKELCAETGEESEENVLSSDDDAAFEPVSKIPKKAEASPTLPVKRGRGRPRKYIYVP